MLDPDVKTRPTVLTLLTDPWIREQVSLLREELCTQVEAAWAEKAKDQAPAPAQHQPDLNGKGKG
eukprot:9487896-Pyramimonas_sp.AAC.1